MDATTLRAHIREHFSRTAVRLETLQQYEVASDGSDFARYLAGEPGPTVEPKQPWLDRLRSERERGLQRSRVRLVTHPVTDYTRFKCEWGYAPNVEAGEQVLILDAGEAAVSDAAVERLKECGDFWLIDDAHVVVMHYGPDGQAGCADRHRTATALTSDQRDVEAYESLFAELERVAAFGDEARSALQDLGDRYRAMAGR